MNTKERFEYMRPLIEDAAKHNNRALLVDLVKPYIEYIEENFDNCVDEDEEQAAKGVVSWLRAFLIDTAWDKGIQQSPETVGVEGTHDRCIQQCTEEDARDTDKGVGVVQANTHDGTLDAMREVLLPTDHFENVSPDHSAHGKRKRGQTVNMCPEILETGKKNLLDIGNDMCDSSGAAGDIGSDLQTTPSLGRQIEGGIRGATEPSSAAKLKWGDGPFSLKDFVGEGRANAIEDKPLLELLEELKRQVEIS